jgi:DNA-binding NtrC family response regulator
MPNTKILVVDDEAALRTMLAANLELEGYTIIEAENAERALEVAARERPDLVLTDIRMPGMSGVELFRKLRERGLKMPVVLMTAFALEELVQGALEDGAFAVLPKPFDVDHAVRTVRSAASQPAVLVIDDSGSVATTTSAALLATGVSAKSAVEPQEALAAMREGGIDLCVVDLVMPQMSGPELSRKLRELDPSVSIIAMSAHDVPELIRQVAKVGVETVLRKPFGMRELVRAIAVARGNPKRRGAAEVAR